MKKILRTEKKIRNELLKKAKNHQPLRALYKKVGENPEIKIISDTFRFKKAIVEKSLDIIPYQDHFLVCHSKEKRKQMPPHIVFDYGNISGDFIVINIDKENREFKSMKQEDLIWFIQDLTAKTYQDRPDILPSTFPIKEKETISQKKPPQNSSFEKALIEALIHIELSLTKLLKNGSKAENEDSEK